MVAHREGVYQGDQCPLWVKSRHLQCKTACPLYPKSGHVQCTSRCPLSANSGRNRDCIPALRKSSRSFAIRQTQRSAAVKLVISIQFLALISYDIKKRSGLTIEKLDIRRKSAAG